MNKRIGIIGGTFNPIHIAHLIIAETFFYQLQLDKCFFVPTYISPFKINNTNDLVAIEHRLEMLKISINENKKFEIDTYEIDKEEISYTINTIEYFKSRFPKDELFLLIGDDQAIYFDKWKDWTKIIEKVQLCIAKRKFDLKDRDREKINNTLSSKNKSPIWLDNPIIEISSESIRERIRNNKPIKYLVTKEVEKYIINNKLYLT
ncbi:MAG: nicotinate (nicotinamide) nucleotide adenylyltransferase [Candidatus Kapabacteria bacterium]|nr:nicotinate (nicotinamide) nucleotide adenylyltransferase [Candidatus Kapabacteria bacterium]